MNRYVKVTRKPNNVIQVNLIHPIDKQAHEDINVVIENVVDEYKLKTIRYGRSYTIIQCPDIFTMDLVYDRIDNIANLYDNKFRYTLIDVASILIIGLFILGIMLYNGAKTIDFLYLTEIVVAMFCADVLMMIAYMLYSEHKKDKSKLKYKKSSIK